MASVETPAARPPPPMGYQNIIHQRQLLDNFHGNGSLAGCHHRIIKGMDKGIAFFFRQLHGISTGIIVDIPFEHHFRPIRFGALHFDQRRGGRHDDHCLCPVFSGGISDSLGMVSCRCGDQSPVSLFLGQGADLIVGAPDLIGAGKLHVFRLEIYPVPLSAH